MKWRVTVVPKSIAHCDFCSRFSYLILVGFRRYLSRLKNPDPGTFVAVAAFQSFFSSSKILPKIIHKYALSARWGMPSVNRGSLFLIDSWVPNFFFSSVALTRQRNLGTYVCDSAIPEPSLLDFGLLCKLERLNHRVLGLIMPYIHISFRTST